MAGGVETSSERVIKGYRKRMQKADADWFINGLDKATVDAQAEELFKPTSIWGNATPTDPTTPEEMWEDSKKLEAGLASIEDIKAVRNMVVEFGYHPNTLVMSPKVYKVVLFEVRTQIGVRILKKVIRRRRGRWQVVAQKWPNVKIRKERNSRRSLRRSRPS